ncbi:MAG: hypothetical protein HQL37_01645 [Alphaproteobacteria bacterium]|nr:hypothetical protein [Alphaproteobacteria bacterium]
MTTPQAIQTIAKGAANVGKLYVGGKAALVQNAGTPTSGSSGTLAGNADVGALLVDTVNGVLYQNTGTNAVPAWTAFAPVTAAATGITAATTQTRVGATALTVKVNNIATVANSGDAVALPAAIAGKSVVIFNSGAHPASVFPAGASDTIDGGSAGAAVTLTNAKRAEFYCIAQGVWVSAQLGVVSA